ncbi:MAG: acyltransferase family protein, partial [Bacteroidaceae bacterium]
MYKYITVAKGIGIILVIMGHFTSSLYMPTYYTELKTWIFSFHMPLFMLLAGFLFQLSISKKEENYSIKSFVYKKFRRLMIPYFFISFAIAGLNLVLGQFVIVKRTVDWHYLTEIFYTNVGGSAVFLWFMYSLFVIFIIAVLFSQLKHGFIWMGLCSLFLFFIPLPNVFYLSAVHSYLFYFWCGCCLFVLQKKQLLRLSLKELLCSAVVFALFYGLSYDGACWNITYNRKIDLWSCRKFSDYLFIKEDA